MKVWKIKFQDKDFILASPTKEAGPIVTEEDFKKFRVSYADMKSNGDINRFGKIIGQRSDITFIEEIDIEFDTEDPETVDNFRNGWRLM